MAPGEQVSTVCAGCRREVTAVVWPALDRGLGRGPRPEPAGAGRAGCFSCAGKAATGVCEGCGRHTCPGCEAEWFGEKLCLSCLHGRRELTGEARFRHRQRLYDNWALLMLGLPLVLIPIYGVFLAVLAAPMALFLVIRFRRAPRGWPPRGPWRLLLAGGLAVALLVGVVVVAFGLWQLVARAGALQGEMAERPPGRWDEALEESGEFSELEEAGEAVTEDDAARTGEDEP